MVGTLRFAHPTAADISPTSSCEEVTNGSRECAPDDRLRGRLEGWAAIPICDSRYWCRCVVEVWNCVHVDISSGSRIGKRARLGNARGDPSLWRADATSIAGKDFLPAIALEEPVVGQGHGRFANGATME